MNDKSRHVQLQQTITASQMDRQTAKCYLARQTAKCYLARQTDSEVLPGQTDSEVLPGQTRTNPLLTKLLSISEWLWFKHLQVDIKADEQALQLTREKQFTIKL